MSNQLRAGFGRSDITPKLGSELTGYGGRKHGATGVHDKLLARVLVLEDSGGLWALISIDFCYLFPQSVADIRAVIEERMGIPTGHVFIATTHTHSGPHDRHSGNWERPLGEIVADAVAEAKAALQPAQVGTGYSFLVGYSINRRWLDKPADPAILVLRVDDAQGNLLGLLSIHGCHAVVLGYDNYEISGDWPGYAMCALEEKLGPGVTSMFFQGGAGDINPLVEGVRKRLRSGKSVRAIGDVSTYYGPDDKNGWSIGDRGGGAFEEVAELGAAYADEVAHLLQTITTKRPEEPIWAEQITINGAAAPGEHPERPSAPILNDMLASFDYENIPTELMLFALGDLLLVSEPGEVFSETAVNLRVWLRNMGYKAPMLVSYANGWFFYLPEPTAFLEGGYEPRWAATLNISQQYQAKVWDAIKPILQQRAEKLSLSA
jgi:hypothetical protein